MFGLFGFFIWLLGRFQKCETFPESQDKTYERIKRKSPSDYSQGVTQGATPTEVVHLSMSETLRRAATPMLLSVDGAHFGMTPLTNSTSSVSMETETREDTTTHTSVTVDSETTQGEPAVSYDVHETSPTP